MGERGTHVHRSACGGRNGKLQLDRRMLLDHRHRSARRFEGNDPSACVEAAMSAYLVGLRTPDRGSRCGSDHEPFDPAFGQR